MKSRIICLCLALFALIITTLMTADLINSNEYEPPMISSSKDKDKVDVKDPSEIGVSTIEFTDKAISEFYKKVESFVDTLAYGAEKNTSETDAIIENLNGIRDHMSSSKIGNKAVADYLDAISSALFAAKGGYNGDDAFAMGVSNSLKNIDEAKLSLTNEKYPNIDTEVGGSFNLALYTLYEESLSKDDSVFTVTVGGGALLGDILGTSDENKFSSQIEKYDYLYPLHMISAVTSFDDMTFISLEAPLTTAIDSTSINPAKGKPDYAKRLLGINAVSLASSAITEYGDVGLDDTVKSLRAEGISYSVQEGSQSVATDFGKVVFITFDLRDTPVTDEQKARNEAVVKAAVQTERENGADLIIVQLHWNTRQRKTDSLSSDYVGNTVSTYEPHFDVYNKEIARAAIGDGTRGADLVVGYGGRVAQGIEEYNGKMIVYQPGDLVYTGEIEEDVQNTEYAFLFRQTFKKASVGVKAVSYRIIPIVNTSDESPYLPTLVFDERADKVIENLVYQSRYFGSAIKNFNYIKIEK